jgi:hypothetical protein
MNMFPQITDWLDAYNRDISVLTSARKALLSHPLNRTLPKRIDAPLCRLLATAIIGHIEHLLESWQKEDPRGILRRYFETGKDNGAKVRDLLQTFQSHGIQVDPAVFEYYLAVKYLRNAVVHARWKDYEQDWVSQHGFPTDTQELTKPHWERMLWVNDNMTRYLIALFLPGWERTADRPPEMVADRPPVLFPRDFERVLWNNLEAIDQRLCLDLRSATEQGRISGSWGSKEEWWTLLWNESRTNHGLFSAQRQLVEPALFSWDEYRRLTFERINLTTSELQRVRDTLRDLRAALDSQYDRLTWLCTGPGFLDTKLACCVMLPVPSWNERKPHAV